MDKARALESISDLTVESRTRGLYALGNIILSTHHSVWLSHHLKCDFGGQTGI